MGGGLLQLTFQGQMNVPLFFNPKISCLSVIKKAS